MWPTLLFGLLLASVAGWIFTAYYQTRRIRRLERSHEEIQVEETLVFDFLHGLGEAFIESYLRLHSVTPGEGLIGRVWQTGQSLYLNDLSEVPELAKLRGSAFGAASVMAAALSYAKQGLGVLAVANGPLGAPFSQGDFVVFKSIAEQSAFALYNAIIYSMANEKKRLDHDLEIARDIQRILLPSEAPAINGFQISGLNVPARQVSGDYFDYIRVDDERLGVAIADVSGKGVPASLIMAICRSVLRAEAARNPSPADVLRKVNRQLYPDIKEDMFISMAYLILDHQRDGVTLARAGHDAPLLYKRHSQTVTPIKPPGMVVGIDSGNVFDRLTADFAVPLERDDCLVLYTDGVTEALNTDGDEFGLDRMIQSVRASATEGAQTIVKRIIEDVRSFIGSVPQNDDITVIAIRKT